MLVSAGQITGLESLFSYGDNEGIGNYSNPDFIPSFKNDILLTALEDITSFCGGNTECIYDYTVSGSQEVAAATLQANTGYTMQENQACMFS